MRVFVTGATGFIGSVLVKDLITAGHKVLGLTRSDTGAKALAAAGAEVRHGSLEDVDGLRKAADESEGVIHLAFNHDFSKFQENCENDFRVIEAMGSVLIGSERPFVVTSGTGIANSLPGQPAKENNPTISHIPRAMSEKAAEDLAKKGVRISIVRLPQVHDPLKQGLITYAVQVAREKGRSAYIGDGSNRWPAAHVSDAAVLYRLALEKNAKRAVYHAVGEEGVSMREIAEVLGEGLKLPAVSITEEEAPAHFGWLAMFAGRDMPASSTWTRKELGWNPTGPSMLSDLKKLEFATVLA
ncbi:MAG TPA: SDR family oxidoreductase [Oculatellaceae cyanobacterium]